MPASGKPGTTSRPEDERKPGPRRPPCGALCPGPHLTDRELDVCYAIVKYITVKATAQALHLSPETVKMHLRTLRTKLGVTHTAEIFRAAATRGVFKAGIDPPVLSGRACLAPKD